MLLTILTPTYNRGNLLKQCYESLENQSLKDFEWVVIDDGSQDDTREIIAKISQNSSFPIRYFYKVNGGKHTALNLGFHKAKGTLTMILDSDDRLTEDAVETIELSWNKYKDVENLSSIAFLRCYSDKKIIGDLFPEDEFKSNHIECRINLGIKGDKSEVYITKILQRYKFPVFEGEKFLSEGLVWTKMGREYVCIYINKAIYITEYLDAGLTKSGRLLRIKCPLGGMESCKEGLHTDINIKQRIKHMLLYQCYGFFAKKKLSEMINNCGYRILFTLCIPGGYLLYKYWKYRYEN